MRDRRTIRWALVKRGLDTLTATDRRALSAILFLAVALRVAAALFLGNGVEAAPGIYDQISYDSLAVQVLSGHGFTVPDTWWPVTRAGEPTAHWSYLYTLYLAAVYFVVGHQPLVARLIQAVLAGSLQPWLTWRIGRRLYGPRVGVVAAALSAVYAYFVYYAGALMTETFFILAVLWALDLATAMNQPLRGPSTSIGGRILWWGKWLLLGVALGLAALLRQAVLILVPLLLAWLAHGGRTQPVTRRRERWGMCLSIAVLVSMILPWTLHNYRAFDRFVLLNTNAGYAFFWGNHPIHGTNFVPILPHDGPSYAELIPKELRDLDEASLDRALLSEGLRFVARDPTRWALLSLSRTREYFKFWWSADSGRLSNVARIASFGLYLPFVILGVGISVCGWRGGEQPRSVAATRPPGLGLLCGFVLSYSLIHLLSWALIRYRLPVDAVLVLFAAVGVVWIFDRVSTCRWPTRVLGPRLDDAAEGQQAS